MNSNWRHEISSGYSGYRCTQCGIWRYATDSLRCNCVPVKKQSIQITITVPLVERGNFDSVTRSFDRAATRFSLQDLTKILLGETVTDAIAGVSYKLVD